MFRRNSTWKLNKSSRKKTKLASIPRENHKEFTNPKKINKLISKPQQRPKHRTGKHNAFTEEINYTALSTNDNREYDQSIQGKHKHIKKMKK